MSELKLKMSIPQQRVLTCRQSRILVMAGQRAGKSYGIGVRSALYVRNFPQMVGMIAANTHMQLTQSTLKEVRDVWSKHMGLDEYDKKGNPNGNYVIGQQPPEHFTRIHQFKNYTGIVSFSNGAIIFTASLDNYLAHDGKTLGWAELDETKDTEESAVKMVILARLSQKGLYYDESGNLLYTIEPLQGLTPYNPCTINTSPAEGTVQWIDDMFELGDQKEEILRAVKPLGSYYYRTFSNKAVVIYSTYWNKHNLVANYIETRLAELTEGEALKMIFGYPFGKTGAEYYHEFKDLSHVKPLKRLSSLPDHLTYDFNVHPYMTLVTVQIEETADEFNFNCIKEYCYKPPANSTEEVTTGFLDDNVGLISDVFYYGDAQGTRDIEGFGSGITRFDPVRTTVGRFNTDYSDRTTRVNPSVNARRKLINRIFAGKCHLGHKKVNIFIDGDGCPNLVADMTYLKQGPKGKLKEVVTDPTNKNLKYEKYGHTSDALEYLVAYILEDLL